MFLKTRSAALREIGKALADIADNRDKVEPDRTLIL
jgi:hypothetical protein